MFKLLNLTMLCSTWAHFKFDACYRSQISWDGDLSASANGTVDCVYRQWFLEVFLGPFSNVNDSLSGMTDWMKMRSDLCLEHWLLSDLCKQKSHIIIRINGKINVCKCKRIFLIYTLQQKIEIRKNSWWKYKCSKMFCHHYKSNPSWTGQMWYNNI